MLNPEVAALDAVFRPQGIASSTILNLYDEVLNPLLSRLARTKAQVVGILGLQGAGKTTLCSMLCELGSLRGLTIASISIDDLYLSYARREELRREDSRFAWRGPPGTHDVAAGIGILSEFKGDAKNLRIPRFDKSTRRIALRGLVCWLSSIARKL
jgi:D-glycerate 3-kinase